MGGSSRSTSNVTNQAFDNRTFIDDRDFYRVGDNISGSYNTEIFNEIDNSTEIFNEIDASTEIFNEVDNSISLDEGAIFAQGNVTVERTDAEVLGVALDGVNELTRANIEAQASFIDDALKLADETVERSLTFAAQQGEDALAAASGALSEAFDNTAAGLAETLQFTSIGTIVAAGAIAAAVIYFSRKKKNG